MERLTKNINGMVWFASQDTDLWLEPYEMSTHDIRTAIKKLAAYEDTGLTPEEINTFYNGRLAVLPCRPGATLWWVVFFGGSADDPDNLYPVTVKSVCLFPGGEIRMELSNGTSQLPDCNHLFYSREAAEAALKKRKEEKHGTTD